MPKLPALTPRKVVKALKKKGFILLRSKGSHRIYQDDEGTMVVVPFHAKELPKGTLIEILKQAGIDRDELEELL